MFSFAFYDAKPYDKTWFDRMKADYDVELKYIENKLNHETAFMAQGCDGVIAFVNDTIDKETIDILYEQGIRLVAMRCAGYNNVDFKEAFGKIHVVRVPAYSPYAVAEYAAALLFALNRKIHRAYLRTREFDFSINGLTGFDLHGKTVGVIGTGKIGQMFINICKGIGLHVLAYDLYPADGLDVEYTSLEELYKRSDIISLHCPLTKDTYHMINHESIALMKDQVILINTSRGSLIDSDALLEGIKAHKVGGAGLDVYEEEAEIFYEDFSDTIIQDDVLAILLSMPNVIITSHQAVLTNEALENIAETTLQNIKSYFDGVELKNEICYQCLKKGNCDKSHKKRCF